MKNTLTLFIGISLLLFSSCDVSFSDGSDSYSSESSGTGGSMARFTIKGDHLYTVTSTELKVFDISDTLIKAVGEVDLSWGVETIFPLNNYLLIGTMWGMQVMDISNPDEPEYAGTYEHVVSCDPVVAYGQYAYVTLHSEDSWCGRNVNELHVIDLNKVLENKDWSTEAENQISMNNPLGLGVTKDFLFVCDDVLKVYDRTDPVNLKYIQSYDIPGTYDVIPYEDKLLVISEMGYYQYAIDETGLSELSYIPVNQ